MCQKVWFLFFFPFFLFTHFGEENGHFVTSCNIEVVHFRPPRRNCPSNVGPQGAVQSVFRDDDSNHGNPHSYGLLRIACLVVGMVWYGKFGVSAFKHLGKVRCSSLSRSGFALTLQPPGLAQPVRVPTAISLRAYALAGWEKIKIFPKWWFHGGRK